MSKVSFLEFTKKMGMGTYVELKYGNLIEGLLSSTGSTKGVYREEKISGQGDDQREEYWILTDTHLVRVESDKAGLVVKSRRLSEVYLVDKRIQVEGDFGLQQLGVSVIDIYFKSEEKPIRVFGPNPKDKIELRGFMDIANLLS